MYFAHFYGIVILYSLKQQSISAANNDLPFILGFYFKQMKRKFRR